MSHFGDVLTQKNEQGVEQVGAPCTVENELTHRIEMCVEEFAEPSGGFFVEIIRMVDDTRGEDAFDEVEAATLFILAGIDAESELADEAAGEDEVEIGPSRFTLFENREAGENKVPKTGVGLFLTHCVGDEFSHVKTLCRLIGMAEGEHVGRLQDLSFANGPYLFVGKSLKYHVKHSHRCHHRAQAVGAFPSRNQRNATRYPTEQLRVKMHELRMVVDGYCGEYNGLCLIGFCGHNRSVIAEFVNLD